MYSRRDKVENSNTTTEVAPTTIETKEVPKPEEKTGILYNSESKLMILKNVII